MLRPYSALGPLIESLCGRTVGDLRLLIFMLMNCSDRMANVLRVPPYFIQYLHVVGSPAESQEPAGTDDDTRCQSLHPATCRGDKHRIVNGVRGVGGTARKYGNWQHDGMVGTATVAKGQQSGVQTCRRR